MKLKFVFVILQSLVFSFKLFAVPDTIWTNNFAVNGQPIFTSDGSKIIINGWECISASDGQTLWHNDAAEEHFYYFITHDDSCVVSRQSDQIKYYSINSGNLVRSLDTIYKKNWLPVFSPHDTDNANYKSGWQYPFISTFIYGDDDSIAYIVYVQEYIKETTPTDEYAKAVLCRYDLRNDTIVTSRVLTLANDTVLTYLPWLRGINIPNTNYFLVYQMDKYDGYNIRLYDKTTLETVSIYRMNFDKHGEPGDFVPTHSGNRLAICNDKGYLLILNVPDLTINTDILLSTQSGYNLATLSFSMDDSLIVTLENWKKFDGNRVRRLSDTVVVYKYNQDYYGGYIDISPDNSKIIFSSLERTILMNARWNPTTVDQEQDPSPMLVYPNPGDDYINIKINNPMSKIINIGVFDENGLLVKEFKKETSDSNEIRFSIENLQQGAYLIRINQDSTNKSYKLIINR